jgi:CRISPR-associated endonuclease/helicase Cas3
MQEVIHQKFKTLTGFKPRAFQAEAIAQLLLQKSVLLRAPTGSGKTETAITPFLLAALPKEEGGIEGFPKKLIYIVPLRTLATSLRERAVKLVAAWEAAHPPKRPLVVTLQTGENPEDPRFEGDIIFCTIDQLLSSFLSIPYSVGRGSANVNAGVVFASYLVFDELHLLDPDRSFATTLKLLEQVQGISPYLLMTATLTHELAAQIQQEVTPKGQVADSVLSLVNVEDEDLQKIEGSRNRRFLACDGDLSAEVILQDIQGYDRRRVLVICNTVAKSQGLFLDLQAIAPEGIEITLLHSRFLPVDRKQKEMQLQKVFAEGWKAQDDGTCQVLISTQVVEAGINITSEVLHTQLCPMNSLLQRAGRCARFRGESGMVKVYRQIAVGDDRLALAISEDDDEIIATVEKRKTRQFLPYPDPTCELTWETLMAHQAAGKADLPVGFEIEAEWINRVHSEEDRSQARKRSENRQEFETNFDQAVFRGDRSVAQALIRHVDSRSVFMIEDPVMIDLDISDDVNIRQLQPFSLPRTTLIKTWREYVDSGDQLWIFKKIVQPDDKKSEGYALPKAKPISSQRELTESIRLVVNPRYVSYDAEVGLQIGVKVSGNFKSPEKPKKQAKSLEYSYRMDTYLGHLGRMWTCWERDFVGSLKIDGEASSVRFTGMREELGMAGGRFLQCKIFPERPLEKTIALFELLVFLAIITHDLGKLQVKWQAAMGGWQKTIFDLYSSLAEKPDPKMRITNHGDQLLAHTDHRPEYPVFKQAYDDYIRQNERPPHAVESSFLAYELLEAALTPILEKQFGADESQVYLIRHVVEMAAGRHHSAWAKGFGDDAIGQKIQLHPQANEAIQQSWTRLVSRLSSQLPLPQEVPRLDENHVIEEAFPLDKAISVDDLLYQQLYWLIARGLRICDGRSVQLH